MGWRGPLVGACVLAILTQGFAVAKPRRDWVDPPMDLPVAAPPAPASVEPDPEAEQQDAVWTGAGPVEVLAAAPQVIRAGSKSSAGCALRTYAVAPGATVRVHAC